MYVHVHVYAYAYVYGGACLRLVVTAPGVCCEGEVMGRALQSCGSHVVIMWALLRARVVHLAPPRAGGRVQGSRLPTHKHVYVYGYVYVYAHVRASLTPPRGGVNAAAGEV